MWTNDDGSFFDVLKSTSWYYGQKMRKNFRGTTEILISQRNIPFDNVAI